MRINGYRCDGCGKEHLLDPNYVPEIRGYGLPDDWLMLTKPNLSAIEQPRFFCALSCLHRWLQSTDYGAVEPTKTQRRLTLILKYDLSAGNDRAGYIHARGRTVYELFRDNFPEAEELDETIQDSREANVTDWKYTLADAYDEHIAWAKLAKECGLIDHYVVDEVPA